MNVSVEQKVESLVAELVAETGSSIYDVEFASGVLRVTVDREGGIDVDAIGELSRSISAALDEHESVVPGDNYMLEVTSPGIERKLRRPQHFEAVAGRQVKVKLRHGSGANRRVEGTIVSADGDAVVLATEDGQRRLDYSEIESARSVYDFAAALEAAKHSSNDEPVNDDDEKATAR